MAQAVFTSSARGTGTHTSSDIPSAEFKGGIFTIDITAVSGTSPTATFNIFHKDQNTGKYSTALLTSTALTSVGTTRLRIYPGIQVVANLSSSDILGDEFRVTAVIGGTTPSFTFTVTYDGVK